jgi:hypothetical protein
MSTPEDKGWAQERRAARRFDARCAARLQFVTGISGVPERPGVESWPNLICRTRDVSESGLGLEVPVLRDSDDGFFGIEGPVRMTLGLPTGVVETRGVVARYAKEDGEDARGGFVICVRITEMGGEDAGRFRAYLSSLSRRLMT